MSCYSQPVPKHVPLGNSRSHGEASLVDPTLGRMNVGSHGQGRLKIDSMTSDSRAIHLPDVKRRIRNVLQLG